MSKWQIVYRVASGGWRTAGFLVYPTLEFAVEIAEALLLDPNREVACICEVALAAPREQTTP